MGKRRKKTENYVLANGNRFQMDVVNMSTVVSGSQMRDVNAAMQKQVDKHFMPHWNIGCVLDIVPTYQGNPTVFVVDQAEDAGFLGYHDINNFGVPIGFVFAETQNAAGWTSTYSHEVLEILSDPFVNISAEGQFIGQPAFFAYENCDPVQEDLYEVDGVTLSDFVLPSWFVNGTASQYDFLDKLDAPFTLSNFGYFSYFKAVGEWIDVTTSNLLPATYKSNMSRWMRRRKKNNPKFNRKNAKTIQYLDVIRNHNLF